MVFCYKIITESPRRPVTSPRKKSSSLKCDHMPSTVSELIVSVDYEGSVLDSIPEHDWRLLAALARKREENEQREKLAEQFRNLWQKEKRQRETIAAETSEEFKRYVKEKRARERAILQHKQFERSLEQQVRKGELMDIIKYKEHRSANILATQDDRKMTDLMDRALEEEYRAMLAADRRSRKVLADDRRRGIQLVYAQRKEYDASKRRNAFLRDASQRVAIGNTLSEWDAALLRQEVEAEEEIRRAQIINRSSHHHAKAHKWANERERRQRRTGKLAALTARLRDAVINGQL